MADTSMLEKLMASKKGKTSGLDPSYKSAKMGVLKDLHSKMGEMAGDDVRGLKKVTVAAPDKSGLKTGLQKAEELLGAKSGMPEGPVDEAPEGMEELLGEEETAEAAPTTVEECDAKIQELEELKHQMILKGK